MTVYTSPLESKLFLLNQVLTVPTALPDSGFDSGTIKAVLEQAGKLAADVLAPLNKSGDQTGAIFANGAVTTAPGFKEAYRHYCAGGWNAVPFAPEHGGQGLPWVLAFSIQEEWQAANMAFGLCPLLNQGAVEALVAHGTPDQQKTYLPKMVSGEWTGTMNLTEPQAGSDLAALTTRATKQKDGTYKIAGQKIYITYGDHDLTDNIIHLVLARIDGAPAGVRGISLFVVPKIMPDGSRNDVTCASIEHKLGIHASPTCTMIFGEKSGAIGQLVGVEGEGLKAMFTMMNNARLSVGLQGVAIAERATQAAVAYARDRVQGKSMRTGEDTAIIHHPDVRRMLLTMQAMTLAGRAMTYEAGLMLDRGHAGVEAAKIRADLMTPIVKGWCTDMAQEVTSLGVQVHGGMGYIEETGAAQYVRDARILPIYEGTNGIQAQDLVFRKILKDGGEGYRAWRLEAENIVKTLQPMAGEDLEIVREGLVSTLKAIDAATDMLLEQGRKDLEKAAAVATPYLRLMGLGMAGVMMARVALAAHLALGQGPSARGGEGDSLTAEKSLVLARFFAEQILPASVGLSVSCRVGATTILASDLVFSN